MAKSSKTKPDLFTDNNALSDDNAEIELPFAVAAGERIVSGFSIPVYNLNNGLRVFSERGFLAIIGAKGRGSTGGHRLLSILADPIIKPFFSKKVLAAIEKPIVFLTDVKTHSRGYPAEILKDFCAGFVSAREAKALRTPTQLRYASYCQALILAFAEMGINYWIDEATGFQDHRVRDDLHRILEKYIGDEAQRWSKTFPDEFYEEMCRLKGWQFTVEFLARKPSVVGHYTNDIVYSRLAPGVLDTLREKNPVIDGSRARKHHQWLTEDHGHPRLKEHISNVIFLMKGTTEWGAFHRALQRSAPRLHETAEFDFGDY
jgi:hypothetical protein